MWPNITTLNSWFLQFNIRTPHQIQWGVLLVPFLYLLFQTSRLTWLLRNLTDLYTSNQVIVSRPVAIQISVSAIPGFSNWNIFRQKGIFMIRIIKTTELPITQPAALFRMVSNSKILRVQERFDIINAMLAQMSVRNDIARTCPSLCPL